MMHTGVIDQFDEVRWDMRPSPRFGTLEMRIADGAANLLEVTAISALTHCFVEHFSTMLDRGETLPTLPPWFAQENKWRSARYGMDAIVITNAAGDEELVTDVGRPLAGRRSRRSPSASAAPPSWSRCASSCAGARPTSGSARWPGATPASSTRWSARSSRS